MLPDTLALYEAYASRDPRFDGVFYVGVTSTGVYCRPVCTARRPKAANCRFFESAATAELARFRPCLRCRPELAPGNAPVDDAGRIAALLVQRIDEGMVDDGAGIEEVAARFGWSARQLRRIVQKELGVSPIDLVQTRRLLLAKQLLTETSLPITEVAFASGYASLRRFNDAFNGRYGMPPSRFRKAADEATPGTPGAPRDTFTLELHYRPPFAWREMLRFLAARALAGVEWVTEDAYARTVRLGARTGWFRVRAAGARRAGQHPPSALCVELSHSLTPVLPALLGRIRHLFDLAARPDIIAAGLARDARLAGLVARTPGLRVPGAFDGFELAARAILGQQVTVKGATTLAARYAAAFGERVGTPHAALSIATPTARHLASTSVDALAGIGLVRARAASIHALATAVATGALSLEAGADPERTIASLVALPGIGPWTAHYIAMRALRWPDAFPSADLALRKALGGVTSREAEARSQAWRPWRSYATMHVWAS